MQAMTAVAITVLILILVLIVGRNFWLFAQQRAHNRRQTDTTGGTDPTNLLVFTDTDTPQHTSSSSTDDTDNSTGHAGGSSGESGSESGGGNGKND